MRLFLSIHLWTADFHFADISGPVFAKCPFMRKITVRKQYAVYYILIVTFFAVCSLSRAHASEGFMPVFGAQKIFWPTKSKVLFVGEDHSDPNLAKGLTTLITSSGDRAECIFFELPIDLQSALDKALETKDFNRLAVDITQNLKTSYARVLDKAGPGDPELSKYVADSVSLDPVEQIKTYPIDLKFLELASARHIRLIAYD